MKLLVKKKYKIRPKGKFLLKLFSILSEERFSKYIHWSRDGKSIIIPNKDKFIENVLPKISYSGCYSLFARNLNIYNFRKKRTLEKDLQEYEHKEFNRTKSIEQIINIKRKKFKLNNLI